jgi:hypothetical protein
MEGYIDTNLILSMRSGDSITFRILTRHQRMLDIDGAWVIITYLRINGVTALSLETYNRFVGLTPVYGLFDFSTYGLISLSVCAALLTTHAMIKVKEETDVPIKPLTSSL